MQETLMELHCNSTMFYPGVIVNTSTF